MRWTHQPQIAISRVRALIMPANSAALAPSECGKAPEFVKAGVDFTSRKRSETLDTKFLATEAAHDRAIDHRAMKVMHIDVPVSKIESAFGEIPDEASGETIS